MKALRFQLCLVVSLLAGWGGTAEGLVRSGELAPDFSLQQLDGEQVSLSDFRGKVVLINLFGFN